LVVDQLAATARDNRRTAGEACSLLLAAFGGESSDAAALWNPAVEDSGETIAIGVGESAGRRWNSAAR